MMTFKLEKCFSSNKRETKGTSIEEKEVEEEVKTGTMTTGIPGGFTVFSFKLHIGHATVIPTTRARIDETTSRCKKLLLLMFPMQTREAAMTSTVTTETAVVAAEGDLFFLNSLYIKLQGAEKRSELWF